MSRPSRPLGAVVALAVAVLVAATACNDDDSSARSERTTTTAGAATASGSSADGTATPASGSDGSTTTTLDTSTGTGTDTDGATADAWTAPGEPSPLELGTGVAEPEYPAGNDGTVAEVADGELDLLVLQVDEAGGQVLVDVVELFVGDDAKAAATADGKLRPDETLAGNYYVRDPNPKLRGVALDKDVVLRGEKGTGIATATGIARVSTALIDRLGAAPGIPFLATVKAGKVTELVVPAVKDPTIPG
ncbi:MAG TPA: hypothetical protein PLS46_01230 [Microthrixaceae bacterium]|nr:hypothetical protein [Microthrixaceae bacterium]